MEETGLSGSFRKALVAELSAWALRLIGGGAVSFWAHCPPSQVSEMTMYLEANCL